MRNRNRETTNIFGVTWEIKRFGRDHRWYVSSKRKAINFAYQMAQKNSGDWSVIRIDRNGQRLRVWSNYR